MSQRTFCAVLIAVASAAAVAPAAASAQAPILPKEAIYDCTWTKPPNLSGVQDTTLVVVDGGPGYAVYRYQAFFTGGGVQYHDGTVTTPSAIPGGWRFIYTYMQNGYYRQCSFDVTQNGTHLKWHACTQGGYPIGNVLICQVAADCA